MKPSPLLLAAATLTLCTALHAQQTPDQPAGGTGAESAAGAQPAAAQPAAPAAQATAQPLAKPAESSTSTTTTSSSQTSSKAAGVAQAPGVPDLDLLKKARNAGYHTKVSHNVVYFCRTDTPLGTRFPEERCYNEVQFVQRLDFEQAQRDQMSNHACSGAGCSSSK